MNSTPAYSISGRHNLPTDDEKPGPGAYSPEKVKEYRETVKNKLTETSDNVLTEKDGVFNGLVTLVLLMVKTCIQVYHLNSFSYIYKVQKCLEF